MLALVRNVRCGLHHRSGTKLSEGGSCLTDSGLDFFLKWVVVASKRNQVINVIDFLERSPFHGNICLGQQRSSTGALQQFFGANDTRQDRKHQNSMTVIEGPFLCLK